MAKSEQQLNYVAEQIFAVLKAREYPLNYLAEKRAVLADLDKPGALFWATRTLDGGNLASLATRLGVELNDLKAAGRVLRAC